MEIKINKEYKKSFKSELSQDFLTIIKQLDNLHFDFNEHADKDLEITLEDKGNVQNNNVILVENNTVYLTINNNEYLNADALDYSKNFANNDDDFDDFEMITGKKIHLGKKGGFTFSCYFVNGKLKKK